MLDKAEGNRPHALQLLQELEQVQEEFRTVNLREAHIIEKCQRRLDELKRNIQRLKP